MEMAVKSMETAVEAMESMEMAPGALPRSGRVPEQTLLSPEIGLRRWRRCGTFLGETPTDYGFCFGRLYIGGEAVLEGGQGPHTWWWHVQGAPAPPYGVPAPWPPSGSPSDFVLCQGKIEGSGFISSNSENISCVTFLKHKNSRKQGTGTVASR
jgi:hypothetical protein